MRRPLTVLAFILSLTARPAVAVEVNHEPLTETAAGVTDPKVLRRNVRATYGTAVWVDDMQCVDASSGFKCIKDVGGAVLRFDAAGMGMLTLFQGGTSSNRRV